jgi:hypothetical protein
MGYPDEEIVGLYSDYSSLTKPSSVKDENFIQIVIAITATLKKVLPPKSTIDFASTEMLSEDASTEPLKLHIYSMGPKYRFYRVERPESIVGEIQSEEWLRTALEPTGSTGLDKEDFRSNDSVLWFHLPVNNTLWVRVSSHTMQPEAKSTSLG